jgi:hypothetical protein
MTRRNLREELMDDQLKSEKEWAERTTFPEERLIVALLESGTVADVDQLDEAVFSNRYRPMVRWIKDKTRDHGELPARDAFEFKFPQFEGMEPQNSIPFYLQWLREEDHRGRIVSLAGGAIEAIHTGGSPDEALADLVERGQQLMRRCCVWWVRGMLNWQ